MLNSEAIGEEQEADRSDQGGGVKEGRASSQGQEVRVYTEQGRIITAYTQYNVKLVDTHTHIQYVFVSFFRESV